MDLDTRFTIPEPTLPDPGREQPQATDVTAALVAITWVLFLVALAVAPAVVIAVWRAVL